MAKTMTCPFCGRTFSWVGPVNYWEEYLCGCGADLWLEIMRRIDNVDEEKVQIDCLNG